jgi:hypothetical protein
VHRLRAWYSRYSYIQEHFARDDDGQRRMYRGFHARQGTGISICVSHWPPQHHCIVLVYQPGVFVCREEKRREEKRGVREGRRLSFERSTHRCSYFKFVQAATEKAPGGRWSLKVSPADGRTTTRQQQQLQQLQLQPQPQPATRQSRVKPKLSQDKPQTAPPLILKILNPK